MSNETHDRWSRTSLTNGHIQTVRDLLENNRHLIVAETAYEVDINVGRIHTIIYDELGLLHFQK